jgi:signal peptidase I
MTFKERISAASKSQWLRMLIANISCVLFVLWSGYYVLFLLLLVFFDIYITRYVNWGGWKKAKNPAARKFLEWVDAIGFALIAVYFINTFFFQNYQIPSSSLEKSLLVGDFLCVSKVSYGARSPMTPFSFPLVQHTFPVLNTKSYLEKPQLEYKRLTGFGHVNHGDIVVFNYPSGDTVALNRQDQDYYVLCQQSGHDNVNNHPEEFGRVVYRPVDRRENYVKRCVGLPGDILQLRENKLFINNKQVADPENMQLSYFVQTDGTPIPEKVFDELGISKDDYMATTESGQVVLRSWNLDTQDSAQYEAMGFVRKNDKLGLAYQLPLTKAMVAALKSKPYIVAVIKDNVDAGVYYPITIKNKSWGRANYGPIWIPKRGTTLRFDKDTELAVATYRRCIENYEGNKFEYRDGKVYINGIQTNFYTFKLDYYFMMGDNRDNSADSRVWGFVPEDHIVGQPMFIWMSLNKDKTWLGGKIRWNRLFTSAHKH